MILPKLSFAPWYHEENMTVERIDTYGNDIVITVNYTFSSGGNLISESFLKIVSDRIGKLFME